MLHAADALVTVESLSAVEALALGRPVLLLNMPNNMRELVDEGAALGVSEGEDPARRYRRCSSTRRRKRAWPRRASATCRAWPAASTAAPPNGS